MKQDFTVNPTGKARLDRIKNLKLGMKMKLTLSLSAIAISLLVSSIISVMEYRSMSNYVSGLIADNVKNINVAQKLADASNKYNLDILSVIGDEELNILPDFDQQSFVSYCDSLRNSIQSQSLADSVIYAYSAYMLTSMELNEVMLSDFIDSREWYFERLQPQYNRLRGYIDAMSSEVYEDLAVNSATFERGFYRSIIPGIVAICVGLLLVLMLLFFVLVYYVNPIYKMLDSLSNYNSFGKKYNYSFDGDDQLSELNEDITNLVEENVQLRKRISDLRNKINQ